MASWERSRVEIFEPNVHQPPIASACNHYSWREFTPINPYVKQLEILTI